MSEEQATPLIRDEHEISRLVAHARKEGQADPFYGKRRWVRYQLGMRLEITDGGTREGDTWPVLMHSISGGGFGVWSKKQMPPDQLIFIRQWTEANSAQWLPARVTHCTVGLQGYLIGARFENPCPPDQIAENGSAGSDPADVDGLGRRTPGTRRRGQMPTLQGKAALSGAVVGVLGGLLALAMTWTQPPETLLDWAMLSLAACGLVGAGIGWHVLRREAHFLGALRVGLHRLARGFSEVSLTAEAPSRELAAVRRTFLDLAAHWQHREEEERTQRQKLEELTQVKSNILSIVSHDLRTPLTSILLYAQMLTEEAGQMSVEDQQRFLQIISDECTRLSRLVDDLLEVQRWEAGRVRWDVKPQDLSGTIRSSAEVFEAMATNKSIEFTVDCPDTLPPVEADADKISQVLSNLLSNALKYTPEGGKVHLSAEARGNEVLFRVSDTGPGIPRDKWDQIFDRFSQLGDLNTTQIDGVGLGLYIVKRIVEHHGGVAWVDSELGVGSDFCVLLPTKAAGVPVKSEVNEEKTPPAGRVLVCDPDPELSAMIAQTLRNHGYEVRVCHSGRRLIDQLTQGDVDVVITDVLLPDMNATEVLHLMEKLPERSFTLIVHTYTGDQTMLRRHGVDIFLRRPVSREELLQAVDSVTHRRTGRATTTLIVDGGGLDVSRFRRLLTQAGQQVMAVETLAEAATQLREHQIDRLLVSAATLSANWDELGTLTVQARIDTRIVVLCHPLRKRERRLAEDRHVMAVEYRAGLEESVLRQVNALTAAERDE